MAVLDKLQPSKSKAVTPKLEALCGTRRIAADAEPAAEAPALLWMLQ